MSTEAIPVVTVALPVVEEKRKIKVEIFTDGVFVELGQASSVTKGGVWGQHDGGIGRQT